MKKQVPLVLFLLILSCLSGYLMSQPSLVGRIGIDLFYKQYKFLRIWWQGAICVFAIWMIFLLLQRMINAKLPARKRLLFHGAMIVLALGGLYFTWQDFNYTTTHRWLKQRFHIGAYLFWVGWILISISLIVQKRDELIQS